MDGGDAAGGVEIEGERGDYAPGISEHDAHAAVELASEPFVALPESAGAQREFWLGNIERRVAAEVRTAEEAFEAVASGLGITLLAAGNAESQNARTSRRARSTVCRQPNWRWCGGSATSARRSAPLSPLASNACVRNRKLSGCGLRRQDPGIHNPVSAENHIHRH